MRLLRLFLSAAFCMLTALLLSCERRPLEVYYLDQVRVLLHVDWQSRFGIRPYGMTVAVFDEEGHIYNRFLTNEVDSVPLSLPVGSYKLIVFNGELDNFASFRFDQPDEFAAFRTVARDNTSRSLKPWDAGTRYSWDPAELLGAAVDSFEITPDMLDRQLRFLEYHDRQQAQGSTTVHHLRETVLPLQTMIHIRVFVNGMENMYRLEANLDGMADGCSMAYTWRNTSECVVLYDSERWAYYFESDNSHDGWVQIDIPTWGEPHGKELAEWRDSTDNVLRMNFTLRNLEERYFEFNVGHLIEYRDPQQDPDRLTPPDVLRHLYVQIKREIPLLPDVPFDEEMGAGFNARVDPWEYGGEFDLGTF